MPVSLLNTDTSFPSFQQETPVRERVEVLTDYLYMLLEELRYTFGNLGAENFNDKGLEDIGKIITKPLLVKVENINEVEKVVAELAVDVGENTASISAITQWQNETDQSIASLGETASQNEANITALAKWKTETDEGLEGLRESMAILALETDSNGASISQIVSAVGNDGEVTAASIVAAVNEAGSSVQISADCIDIASAMGGLTLSAVGEGSTETPFGELVDWDGATYGFSKTSDGYFTSTNQGVHSSYSYAGILFNNTSSEAKQIILRCTNSSESEYDYGLISELNTELSMSSVNDGENVLYSFKGINSADPIDVPLSIPGNTVSWITVKYIKDGSNSSGNDRFKIMPLEVKYSDEGNTSMIRLTYNGAEISSADINIKGFVTFSSLENDGETTVNGNNIALVLNAADDDGNSTVESVSSLWFKYRDVNDDMFDMAGIYTEIDGEDTNETSRYALKLKTYSFMNNDGNWVYPSIKLLSAGRASIESMFGIFLGTQYLDGSYITLDAYDNTRIMAHKTYSNTENYYDEGYCFCTDGIYYNGIKIIST